MPTTAWTNPSSGADYGSTWSSGGTVIAAEDGSSTNWFWSTSGEYSSILYGSFAFNSGAVPDGAVITGFEAQIKHMRVAGGSLCRVINVYGWKLTGSPTTPSNWAGFSPVSPPTDTILLYSNLMPSGPTDLGLSWTPQEARTCRIGVRYFADSNTGGVNVDALQARITYEMPATGGFFF